jgi:hypothetical protein
VSPEFALGSRPELVGGGLIRSAGGWSEVKSRRGTDQGMASDERILGGGDFVQKVLEEAEGNIRYPLPMDRMSPFYHWRFGNRALAPTIRTLELPSTGCAKFDAFVKSRKTPFSVIPAKLVPEVSNRGTGIQSLPALLDSRSPPARGQASREGRP